MMKKYLSPIVLICCLALPGRTVGQNYVGLHKEAVRDTMKEYRRDLFEDNTSRNTAYNMVKYIDNLGNQTLYYFFSEGDTCLYSKWICDYSMLNKVVSGLNESYEPSADDSWLYTYRGKRYRITLTSGEWFFTITTKPDIKE
jgi:hypothetical protein